MLRSPVRPLSFATFGVTRLEIAFLERLFAARIHNARHCIAAHPATSAWDIAFVDVRNPQAIAAWKASVGAAEKRPAIAIIPRNKRVRYAYTIGRPFNAAEIVVTMERLAAAKLETVTQTPRHCALVVDDSRVVRKQLEYELQTSSISPTFADCGATALKLVQKRDYDIVFLDVVMPGMSGYDVCRSIKRN
ncbi:MAG: response regulator, partial [Gammaproteobacteria bacterium]|nr:response regulator [Gammaproteobacteria bacterium]